ncbi:18733_t:CDS:2 [Funneliformis geosporum]|uniref:18733_t:CDS:1 n=1 Tax=Funneliformis geosporum TaxID=1117311 RepID=A0A9W4SYZ3_9GLOM|nr:18733_t:CDS:2 [Funneliformis geosporum]
MKIQNLLDTYAFKCDIVFSSRVYENIEKGKYSDTYVFLPEKGIEMRKPGGKQFKIFLYELARGTTSAGKYNLNLVAEFVTKKGFEIKYDDTDSLYLICSDKYYEKCDEAFSRKDLSKEVYFTEMVKITIIVMKSLQNQQEKYFGVSHKEVVNFRPDDLFMRGIDTVKQENSELFRFIGEKIMWEAMDINNTCSICKIVEDALWDARFKWWDFN